MQPEVETKVAVPRPSGKTYALIIGISSYALDPPVTSLQFADKDAETFTALLKTPIGGELQNQDQIRLLTNEKATRAGVDDAVREMASLHGTVANTLIVFVAAHGVYLKTEEDPETHRVIQRDPYILTYESNPQDAKTTGYPMADFRRMIAEQAEHFGRVLVFLDVCHAGNVAGIGGGTDLEASVRRVFEGRAGELGVMLASHAKKFALESSNFGGGHGAFSYFLISGLNGEAAPPGTTEITFANLAVYVVKERERVYGQPADAGLCRHRRRHGAGGRYPQSASRFASRATTLGSGSAKFAGASYAWNQSAASIRGTSRHGFFRPSIATGPIAAPGPWWRLATAGGSQERSQPISSGDLAKAASASGGFGGSRPGSDDALSRRRGNPPNEGGLRTLRKVFEEALHLRPDAEFDRSRALFCEGRARIFDGQYAEAQRLLESSIQIDPKRAYAYNALGIAQLEQIARTGQGFDAATDALRNAMRYAPYWAYPIHNLALVSSERGDYDRAIQLYQYAMSIAPRYSYLPYNLGLLYERIGDFDNANIWFEKARVVLETYGRRAAAPPGRKGPGSGTH